MSDDTSPHQLLEKASQYLPDKDLALLQEAFDVAKRAHTAQLRQTGEPFLVHPLATAEILAEYRLDAATLAAALLHDVPEDTNVSLEEIKKQFGKEIAQLVDGVTKLSQIRLKKSWQSVYRGFIKEQLEHSGENFKNFDRHVETLRKMFLAMSHDIRVILIKLADRLNNLETLAALPTERQQRIAQETLEVYAPLANRLGIGQLKGRLEDLAFPYAMPVEYQKLNRFFRDHSKERQVYIERVRRALLKRVAASGIRGEAHGRAKHLYSLWKKYVRHGHDIEHIYDLVAVRVIVPTIEDCYRVLGLVHTMWKPLPGRIKDYIATPKPNGYQSLHTTVFALGGKLTEIQIRTPAMHHWAEFGIAAHWAYKEDVQTLARRPKTPIHTKRDRLAWIHELAKLTEVLQDPKEWKKGLTFDFFQDRIFVFTPSGDVLDLPVGATPVDFAFAVHSDLGNHCTGAKVNGKLVPISHSLENGDIIEITTTTKAEPKSDWLQFVKTSKARSHIKRVLKLA